MILQWAFKFMDVCMYVLFNFVVKGFCFFFYIIISLVSFTFPNITYDEWYHIYSICILLFYFCFHFAVVRGLFCRFLLLFSSRHLD